MTAPAYTDTCPACGNDDVLPFAFIYGAVELYGYQCPCQRVWLILHSESIYETQYLRDKPEPADK